METKKEDKTTQSTNMNIYRLLEDPMLLVDSFIDLLDQINDGQPDITIKGDVFYALENGFRMSMKNLKNAIHVLDNTHHIKPISYHHTSDANPYICGDCGKHYDEIDFEMLDNHTCNSCGCMSVVRSEQNI